MLATNFDAIDEKKLYNLFEFILKSDFSNFYKKKYQHSLIEHLSDYSNFTSLPLLLKNDILETPIRERTFVDENSIQLYTISSGTSKNPIPSIVPHAVKSYKELNYNHYDAIKKDGKINLLLLLNGTNSSLMGFIYGIENRNIVATIGNVSNLRISATITRELGIDAIVTTPSILYNFIKELENISYDLDTIVWVSLGSEYCTQVMYDVLRSKLKKASFNFRYGNAEFKGMIGYRCDALNKNSPPGVFHVNPHAIVEIVGEDGKTLKMGELGEIILTDTLKKAFPLMRYKIGDFGSLSKKACECGNQYILEFAGRANHDFLKFHGVTLRTEMIYDSLQDYLNIFENRFEMHVYEKNEGGEVKPYFILMAKFQPKHRDVEKSAIKIQIILNDISKKLYLAPKKTYLDLVEMGRFLPMQLELTEKWEDESKSIGIVSHF